MSWTKTRRVQIGIAAARTGFAQTDVGQIA
jgi:hypothetical protein